MFSANVVLLVSFEGTHCIFSGIVLHFLFGGIKAIFSGQEANPSVGLGEVNGIKNKFTSLQNKANLVSKFV